MVSVAKLCVGAQASLRLRHIAGVPGSVKVSTSKHRFLENDNLPR
jgi:hypothetical protein